MALALHRHLPLRLAGRRCFSTTPAALGVSARVENTKPGKDKDVADFIPPYPYPAQFFKQADRGLYGGQRLQFGNNVGPKSKTKTRRRWEVNTVNKRLWSAALERHVRVRVSTRVLRTIDKVGGLDEYLLGEKQARIKQLGKAGWLLRWAVMRTPAVRARFTLQRRELSKEATTGQSTTPEPAETGVQATSAKRARQEEELDRKAEKLLEGTVSLHEDNGSPVEVDGRSQEVGDIGSESQLQSIAVEADAKAQEQASEAGASGEASDEGKPIVIKGATHVSQKPFARVVDSGASTYKRTKSHRSLFRQCQDEFAEYKVKHMAQAEAAVKQWQAERSHEEFMEWRNQVPGWRRTPRKVVEAHQLKMLRQQLEREWFEIILQYSKGRARDRRVEKSATRVQQLDAKVRHEKSEYQRLVESGLADVARQPGSRQGTENLATAS